MADKVQYHIVYQGQPIGPLDIEQLKFYGITPETLVWIEGQEKWQPAFTYPALMEYIYQQPGGQQAVNSRPEFNPYQQTPYQQAPFQPAYVSNTGKDKLTTGLLALLVGFLGVQYFYLGKVGGGFICILLSLVTCGWWSVITFIQGIIILCMNPQEFDQKWVLNNNTFPVFP